MIHHPANKRFRDDLEPLGSDNTQKCWTCIPTKRLLYIGGIYQIIKVYFHSFCVNISVVP